MCFLDIFQVAPQVWELYVQAQVSNNAMNPLLMAEQENKKRWPRGEKRNMTDKWTESENKLKNKHKHKNYRKQ